MNNDKLNGRSASPVPKRLLCAALVVVAAGMVGCGDKKEAPKAGQALASVNGKEITALQLNEELQRANVPAAQQEQAGKQLVQALIDRQLLLDEAEKEKLDRDPKVMQAVERAKALIIAQAYMQKKVGNIKPPTEAEVSDYYNKNPEFFSNRKQFAMQQLVIETKDLSDPLKQVADSTKSIDAVAAWMDQNNVKYARAQNVRSTSDLPPELSSKLKTMPKNQLFVVREGARSMLVSIVDVRDAPVTLQVAAPQIQRFLVTQRNKEAADAELKRLRSTAKVEYLNKAYATAAATPAPAAAPAAPAAQAAAPADDATARGVAGLK